VDASLTHRLIASTKAIRQLRWTSDQPLVLHLTVMTSTNAFRAGAVTEHGLPAYADRRFPSTSRAGSAPAVFFPPPPPKCPRTGRPLATIEVYPR